MPTATGRVRSPRLHAHVVSALRGGIQQGFPVVVLAVLVGMGTPAAMETSSAADPSLEEIRAGYRETIASIGPFHVKYRFTSDYIANPRIRDAESTCEWAVDGRKFLYRREGHFIPSGEPTPPRYTCSDGVTTWRFDYGQDADGQPVLDVIWKGPYSEGDGRRLWSGPDSVFTWAPYVGHYVGFSGHSVGHETLSSLLEVSSASIIGLDEIGDAECWHVHLGRHQRIVDAEADASEDSTEEQVQSDPYAVIVDAWFDPEFGWLPRKIVTAKEGGEAGDEWLVHEYRRVETPIGPVPFPVHCELNSVISRRVLEVDEVVLNSPLSDDLFRPELPQGVRVVDVSNEAVFREEQRRIGRLRAERRRPTREAEAPVVAVPQGAARPVRSPALLYILIALGVVALSGAAWTVYRRH